jgi:hypothetical protein
MHPAEEPQSGIGFSHGLPDSQQSTFAIDTPYAALAEANPPAIGSMATAKATKKTKIVRKMLIVSS